MMGITHNVNDIIYVSGSISSQCTLRSCENLLASCMCISWLKYHYGRNIEETRASIH